MLAQALYCDRTHVWGKVRTKVITPAFGCQFLGHFWVPFHLCDGDALRCSSVFAC
jgi:hypothetical protein